MAETVADHLLSRLGEWGVRQVFGYPGDGISGLLAAWGRADDDPQFVQARHEEMAAFEAIGFATFSGTFGVCAATSGPGAIHLLDGLCDAKLSVGPAWDAALSATVPSVLDIRCDPDVPPIPPHATFEQAKDMASAILHGDDNARGIVVEGRTQKVQLYLPGTKEEN